MKLKYYLTKYWHIFKSVVGLLGYFIGGDNYGFQSLDTDLINPAIQNANKIIPHNPPKRSFLEIASWVFGIIVAVIVIYEFIIKD